MQLASMQVKISPKMWKPATAKQTIPINFPEEFINETTVV